MAHSSVAYVEPNYTNNSLTEAADDGKRYDRAPDLEDYCIAMDIEVMLSTREKSAKISEENRCIIMSYRSGDGGTENIRFMSGTKIGGYVKNNDGSYSPKLNRFNPNVLSSYYADMYITDIIDYGTTEMLGIKSIDVEYNSTCVPVITVKFTDVRGMSLFHPSEFNHSLSYNGINGFSKDNIAQSFFQAFFTLPLPIFTIHMKGFYGKPVSYQVMCDKFDSAFDSKNGYFDVTVRFVGFAYSFMADVSLNALLAAPYSDYIGAQYWENKVNNGDFKLIGKYGEPQKMPKLYDIRKTFELLVVESNEELKPSVDEKESQKHQMEIEKLSNVSRKFRNWYTKLFNTVTEKYGKDFCYIMGGDNDTPYKRVIILTNGKNIQDDSLVNEFKQYGDFIKLTEDLYNEIETYNSSATSYRKLENIKKDAEGNLFDYKKRKVFSGITYNSKTNGYGFLGVTKDCGIPESEISEFISVIFSSEKSEQRRKLSLFYNNGEDQYDSAFIVELRYDDFQERIKKLESEKKEEDEKLETERKRVNDKMYEMLGWYPSIENFTKITMAHLETLMHMMYCVQNDTKDRKLKDLGIPADILGDVPNPEDSVGAFPRITKETTDKDGYSKKEDVWLGKYNNGVGFREVDMVNGLFNGVQELDAIERAIEIAKANAENPNSKPGPDSVTVMTMPITPYDFVLKKNPYGDSDVVNNKYAFAGKVAMRMMGVLALSGFRKDPAMGKENDQGIGADLLNYAAELGKIEAHNFNTLNKLANADIVQAIGEGGSMSNGKDLLDIVQGNLEDPGNLPWVGNNDNDKVLLTNNGNLWINRYTSNDKLITVQPLQNMSFESLDKSLGMVNGHKYPVNDEDILIMTDYGTLDEHNVAKIINATGNTSVFNTATVTEQYDQIIQMFENALANNTVEEYKKFAEVIKPLVVPQDPAGKELKNIIIEDDIDIYSFHKRGDDNVNKSTVKSSYVNYNWYSNAKGKQPFYSDKYDDKYAFKLNVKTDESGFINESFTRNIESFTLTEVFGYKYENDFCLIDKDKSLFAMPEFYKRTTFKGRGTGFDKIIDYKDVQVARFLFGIDGFDAFVPLRNIQRSFGYAPKVTILQIGAALAMYHTKIKIDRPFTLKDYVSVFKSEKGKVILPALPTTLGQRMEQDEYVVKSIPQKLALIKYFKKWSNENYSKINELFLYNNLNNIKQCKNSNYVNIFTDKPRDGANENSVSAYTVVRTVFNQDAEVVKTLSKDLLSTVCYVNLTVDGYDRVGIRKDLNFSDGMATRYRVSTSQGEAYLDGFLTELRNLNNIPQPATDPTQMAKEATQTTEAMKIELYRYLKQIYDKWVCATKEEDWRHNQFFGGVNNPGNPAGNNFYFIDSFYNKVGNKIMVNPMSISKRLKLTTSSMDTNVMMYSFLSEVYADHRCMMKCVQNFNLLSDGIGDIFKPVPYSEMVWAASLPDFVVIYSYEPSRNLAVANAEYKDDGFMLNDEDDTPLPITSRSDASKYYKIPAFGVSYGRQYQSYFKSVNVDMSHPVLTEQALIAKHAILATSRGSTYKNVRAQDAYDIYSNQSYTCNVEMMGCAWVQPLMYFVLLNVPFFKGSYLISKVKHHIVPGDMTTTITGVRMSKYCNNIVDNIFSDENSGKNMGGESNDERKYEVANLDNNCPYKIYPVVNSSGTFEGDEPGPVFSSQKNFVVSMYHAWISNSVTPEIAKTITAQAVLESDWGRSQLATEGFNYGGIKSYPGKPTIINRLDGKKYAKFESLDDYVKSKIKAVLDANFPSWRNATTPEGYLKTIMADGMKTRYATVSYAEYSKKIFDIMKGQTFVNALKNVSSTPTNTKDTEEKVNKELPKLFFQAVEKSVASTPNANVKLESVITGNTVTITQSGKNDKMAIVFDIILNSEEYYKYIYKLFWYYAGTTSDPNPSSIAVTVSADIKKNNAERTVLITKTGNGEDVARREKFTNDTFNVESGDKEGNKSYPVAEGFLRSIVKKYDFNKSIFNKECPQFDGVTNIFDRFSPTPCIETMNTEIYGKVNKDGGVKINEGGMIGNWNANRAAEWLACASKEESQHICAFAVQQAVIAGGIVCPSGDGYRKALNLQKSGYWEFVASGKTSSPQINFNPQVGDIIGMTKAGDISAYGHVCMYCGSQYGGWISDFKQYQEPYPYSKEGEGTYWIVRYKGNGKTTNQKPLYCLKTSKGVIKCLNKPC